MGSSTPGRCHRAEPAELAPLGRGSSELSFAIQPQPHAPASKSVLTQTVKLRGSWKQSRARGMDDPETGGKTAGVTQTVKLRGSWKQSRARGMDDPENRRQDRRRYPNGESARQLEAISGARNRRPGNRRQDRWRYPNGEAARQLEAISGARNRRSGKPAARPPALPKR